MASLGLKKSKLKRVLLPVAGLVLIVAVLAVVEARRSSAAVEDSLVRVKRGAFKQVLRRMGTLQPIKEQHIICQIWGTILDIVPPGKAVEKGEVVMRLDATAHEDAKAAQEANLAQIRVEFIKQRQDAAKALNQARLDLECYTQTVELEQRRLDEIKKGPLEADIINAETNLKNAKLLLQASTDQLKSLEILLSYGYASLVEYRLQKLSVQQQELLVTQADIAQKQLFVPDPVKIGGQEIKVQNALDTCSAARERVAMLEQNMRRDRERHELRMQREKKRLDDINLKINKTIYKAPAAGIAIHKKIRSYYPAPGRDVGDGWDVMSLPDLAKMKTVLTVDESHIAQVAVGNAAEVKPAGWNGPPFHGRVAKVADKGVDEFEAYTLETKDIVGTANRQVFEVEVEIEGQAPSFRPGLRAEVEICLQTLPDAFIVPRTAILKKSGATQVRVSSPAGMEQRNVRVLAENELVAAVEGLREDEQVLVANSD